MATAAQAREVLRELEEKAQEIKEAVQAIKDAGREDSKGDTRAATEIPGDSRVDPQ